MPNQDISHIDIRYVADLARLELTDDEIARYGAELDAVLEYMEQLREVDVDGIDPMAHAVPRLNILRDDTVGESVDRGLVIDNAPAAADDRYIRVPAVLDGEEGA